MNGNTSASATWQLVFVSFAVIVILLEVVRGWRLGLAQQIVRVFAVVAAYATAYFGGSILVPLVRPVVQLPDFVISAASGALLALVVYWVITSIGTIAFERTAQQGSGLVRAIYGFSGAFIGLFFGLFFVWLLLVGVRTIGGIADAQLHAQSKTGIAPLPNAQSNMRRTRTTDDSGLLGSFARIKNSVELGTVGDAVKSTDVLPTGLCQTVVKLVELLTTPATAERFLSYPPAQALTLHPRITALQNDPEIMAMIEQGRFLDLMRDSRVIAAVNDPTLMEALRKFDLRGAIDYASQRNSTSRRK